MAASPAPGDVTTSRLGAGGLQGWVVGYHYIESGLSRIKNYRCSDNWDFPVLVSKGEAKFPIVPP
jgi:hypothetical protein